MLAAAHADALLEGVILRRQPYVPLEGALLAQHRMAVDCTRRSRSWGFPKVPSWRRSKNRCAGSETAATQKLSGKLFETPDVNSEASTSTVRVASGAP